RTRARAQCRFSPELPIDCEHHGLIGDPLLGVQIRGAAAGERSILVRKAERILDVEARRARISIPEIQEPMDRQSIGRANLRHPAHTQLSFEALSGAPVTLTNCPLIRA